ncbi:MAG: transcriptional repressor [Planctomycetota bacterium]
MDRSTREKLSREFKKELLSNAVVRREILNCFLQHEGHVTAEQLKKLCADQRKTYSPEQIAEALDLFVHYGVASELKIENRETLYEHFHLGEHHDHIVCVCCGKIEEISDTGLEKAQLAAVNNKGFRQLNHKTIVYGLCPVCADVRASFNFVPLTQLEEDEIARVEKFHGGRGVSKRMVELGLNPGSVVRIISKRSPGPLIIASRDTRIAIGAGLADKILVTPLTEKV